MIGHRSRDDKAIGALLQAHRVVVRPVLFDEAEGDVFLCSYESDRLTLLDDEGFGRLVSETSSSARAEVSSARGVRRPQT